MWSQVSRRTGLFVNLTEGKCNEFGDYCLTKGHKCKSHMSCLSVLEHDSDYPAALVAPVLELILNSDLISPCFTTHVKRFCVNVFLMLVKNMLIGFHEGCVSRNDKSVIWYIYTILIFSDSYWTDCQVKNMITNLSGMSAWAKKKKHPSFQLLAFFR